MAGNGGTPGGGGGMTRQSSMFVDELAAQRLGDVRLRVRMAGKNRRGAEDTDSRRAGPQIDRVERSVGRAERHAVELGKLLVRERRGAREERQVVGLASDGEVVHAQLDLGQHCRAQGRRVRREQRWILVGLAQAK